VFYNTPNSDYQKSFAEFFAQAKNKVKIILAAACTWTKILLRLPVWNLFAKDEQIMHAADCKILAESPGGDFRHARKKTTRLMGGLFVLPPMEENGTYPNATHPLS
jgi:hypothetical protein